MNRTLEQEIERIRQTCIMCGNCERVCPSFKHGGIDPMEVMAGGEEDLDQCIMCGNCSRACRRSDPFTVIRDLIYIEKGMSVSETFLKTGFVRPPAEDRCVEPEWDGNDAYVMLGCVVNSMAPFIEYAASKSMDAIGVRASRLPGEVCCLHPVQFMAMPEIEKRAIRKRSCEGADGRDIVTLCAGCSEELEKVDDRVFHIIGYLHSHLDSLPSFDEPVKVGMEPGCSAEHLRKQMKSVLERMNCVVVNSSIGCCGKNAPVREELMAEREKECEGAEMIVVGCPMCFVKYDSQPEGLPTVHIAELVAMAAGYPKSTVFHRIPLKK